MNEIYFSTSSEIKFNQYKGIFERKGFTLQNAPPYLKLVEPQLEEANDWATLIVDHPLKMIARFVKKFGPVPYMIEDTMLFIDSISNNMNEGVGLPGGDTKNWWKNLGNEGLLKILQTEKNRQAMLVCTIGAIDLNYKYIKASQKVHGTISLKPQISKAAFNDIPLSNPHYFHQIFIPNGTSKTYGEMNGLEFIKNDYREKCASKIITILSKNKKRLPMQLNLFSES